MVGGNGVGEEGISRLKPDSVANQEVRAEAPTYHKSKSSQGAVLPIRSILTYGGPGELEVPFELLQNLLLAQVMDGVMACGGPEGGA